MSDPMLDYIPPPPLPPPAQPGEAEERGGGAYIMIVSQGDDGHQWPPLTHPHEHSQSPASEPNESSLLLEGTDAELMRGQMDPKQVTLALALALTLALTLT